MLVNYVFYKLSNSISSDYSTLFVYFNLELYHTLEICAPSITLINRTYVYLPGLILNLLTCGNYIANYNVNMHPLNLTLILLYLQFVDHFTKKNSILNRHTSLIFSVVMARAAGTGGVVGVRTPLL